MTSSEWQSMTSTLRAESPRQQEYVAKLRELAARTRQFARQATPADPVGARSEQEAAAKLLEEGLEVLEEVSGRLRNTDPPEAAILATELARYVREVSRLRELMRTDLRQLPLGGSPAARSSSQDQPGGGSK